MQAEISLRSKIEDLSASLDVEDGWDRFARETNRAGLVRSQAALGDVQGGLEWSFDGAGVFGKTMQVSRLNEIMEPLGQSLRWIGRDLMLGEAIPKVETDTADLVEPVVSGMFDGSFGIRISRGAVMEQPRLDGVTLFDRAVDRMVDILAATHAEQATESILENVTGLRKHAVGGLRKLAEALAKERSSSWLRWQRTTIVPFSRSDAETLHTALADVEPEEREITVTAVVEGGNRKAGQFHIEEPSATGKPRIYRGKADPGVAATLTGIKFGALVRATLAVIEMESRFLDEPKTTYVLRSIEEVSDQG